MQLFIWVMLGLLLFEAASALYSLATGKIAQRTPAVLAVTVLMDISLITWAAVVLS